MEKDKLLKTLLVIFFILNLIDIVITIYAVNKGATEANPVVRMTLQNLGMFGAFAVKIIIGILIVVALRKVSSYKTTAALSTTAFLTTLYLLTILNNLVVVW